MPKFLNNIDLNGNQLLSPVIHNSSQSTATNGPAGNTTGTEGQIFYNSHAKALYFRDDSAWRPIGDISGVSAGVGLSGGGTGGDVTLTIDFSEFSDVTPVNGDKLATLDSDGSTEQLTTIASLATLFAGSGLTATNSVIAVDTLNQNTSGSSGTVTNLGTTTGDVTTGSTNNRTLTIGSDKVTYAKMQNVSATSRVLGRITSGAGDVEELTGANVISIIGLGNVDNKSSATIRGEIVSGNIPNNAADTSGTAANVTTNANLTGHITSSGNAAVLGSFTVAQLSTALSNASISGNNTGDQTNVSGTAATVTGGAQTAITSVGTLSAVTVSGQISANGTIVGDNVTNISGINTASVKKIELNTHGSGTTLKILDTANQSITLGKTETSGNDDGTSVTVENDLTVKGKLEVRGDVTTTSTSNTVIKDAIIQITGADASTANTSDIGFVFDRGSSGSVAVAWDEGENPGAFKLIATGDTAASADIAMTAQTNDGNNVPGTSAPQGYQNFYAGDIKSVGNTSGFFGRGPNITALNGDNIATGTVAAARVGNLATGKITSGTFANARISSGSVTQHEGDIDHDALTNFASNEHFTQGNITTVGTIGTGVWQGTAIATTYLSGQSGTNTGDETKARINALDITELGTISSGVWQGSVIASTYLDSDTAHVTQTQTLTNKTLTSPVLNTGVSGTAIKDEDNMASNSATHLATQQSIKAYVDAQTSGDSNTGGRQAFVLNNSVDGVAATNSGKTYTVTHGMGSSFNYGVEVIRNSNNSGGGETVYTDVTRTNTTIVIDFATAPTAGNFTALVCKY